MAARFDLMQKLKVDMKDRLRDVVKDE